MDSIGGARALAALLIWAVSVAAHAQTVKPARTASNAAAGDVDDIGLWAHSRQPARSTLVGADKANKKVFVYDTAGSLLQTLDDVGKPGNIDVRYGFPLGGKPVDVVAFIDRKRALIRVYGVDPETGKLTRIDDGAIRTSEGYGFALARSGKSGKFYAVVTSKSGLIEQYELTDDGGGRVKGKKVRDWKLSGQTEGAVSDDDAGVLFVAEERKGLWKVGLEPDGAGPGELVFESGDHGANGDFEGVAVYHLPDGGGYVLLSNQGGSTFLVLDRKAPHSYLGAFSVAGVRETDGIDVINVDVGAGFEKGCFAAHNGAKPGGTALVKWEDIAAALKLRADASWNPRQ